MTRLKAYLLQEAEQEVPGGGVVGEEATDGFVDNVSVQTAAGGRQRPQSTEDEARLLPRHRLLDLLHVLLDICGGADIRPQQSITDSRLTSLFQQSFCPLCKLQKMLYLLETTTTGSCKCRCIL